ncbi:uncharacterized protein A4U43_C04F15600 [Asparagus officinalis]|uniref:Uncharacterized protein n=1 Tax=Asparagus officinalis TaxID=4686 RepID=A0A5P1F5U0_ASPOF|nr:uncharacterized protein A4U43_C04F15600 [Asparagus officinalis]
MGACIASITCWTMPVTRGLMPSPGIRVTSAGRRLSGAGLCKMKRAERGLGAESEEGRESDAQWIEVWNNEREGAWRVLRLEEEELGHDDGGRVVKDGDVDADHALLQELGEDVVGALALGGVRDHHRDQAVGPREGGGGASTGRSDEERRNMVGVREAVVDGELDLANDVKAVAEEEVLITMDATVERVLNGQNGAVGDPELDGLEGDLELLAAGDGLAVGP